MKVESPRREESSQDLLQQQILQLLAEEKPILYNPDKGAMEPARRQKHSELLSLGELSIEWKKSKLEIKALLLTQDDPAKIHAMPDQIKDFHVCADLHSSAQQALDYFASARKDPKFRCVLGWVYSADLHEARHLFNLAQKLKQTKQCIGDKQNDSKLGIAIMYNDPTLHRLFKLSPKWVVLNQ